MKILYIITQGELGGAQRYVFDLALSFGQDNTVIVANGAAGDQWLATAVRNKNPGIQTHRFKHLVREINPLKDLLAFFEIRAFIRQTRPDIIHANSSKVSILVALTKGITPSVYTVHGWVFNEPMRKLKRSFYLWLERFAGRRHNKIIVLGNHDLRIAVDDVMIPKEKLTVIPHGIALSAPDRRAIALHQPVRLATIANLYKTKGLTYLVAAMHQLVGKEPKIKLTIFGDGPQRFVLFEQAVGQAEIIFAGRVPDAVTQLPKFDIFVLPSIKEGFPYVILEAMNAEVPIIATTVGEIPNILENEKTGLLVEPANPQALALAIIKLINNPTLRTSISQAAKTHLANFSFDKMVECYRELYQTLAQR